jgi:hypothetical protein
MCKIPSDILGFGGVTILTRVNIIPGLLTSIYSRRLLVPTSAFFKVHSKLSLHYYCVEVLFIFRGVFRDPNEFSIYNTLNHKASSAKASSG